MVLERIKEVEEGEGEEGMERREREGIKVRGRGKESSSLALR